MIEVFADFYNGLKAQGLDVPEYVILKSNDEGGRLMSAVMGNNKYTAHLSPEADTQLVEVGGKHFIKAEVHGVKVLWPVRK